AQRLRVAAAGGQRRARAGAVHAAWALDRGARHARLVLDDGVLLLAATTAHEAARGRGEEAAAEDVLVAFELVDRVAGALAAGGGAGALSIAGVAVVEVGLVPRRLVQLVLGLVLRRRIALAAVLGHRLPHAEAFLDVVVLRLSGIALVHAVRGRVTWRSPASLPSSPSWPCRRPPAQRPPAPPPRRALPPPA